MMGVSLCRTFRFVLSFMFLVSAAAFAQVPGPGELRIRIASDIETLDWGQVRFQMPDALIVQNLMEGLVRIDENLQIVPALATKWEVSPDGKVYTFTLRSGVKWSDGASLKPEEFLFAWKRVFSPENKYNFISMFSEIENAMAYREGKLKDFSKVGIKILPGGRLEFRLTRPKPTFLSFLSSWVVYPQREDLIKASRNFTQLAMVTVGPYVLKEYVRGRSITLKKNLLYYGGQFQGTPRQVHFLVEIQNAKAMEKFMSGAFDVLLDMDYGDVIPYISSEGKIWRLEKFLRLATVYLGFNFQSSLSSHAEFRRAVAYSLDKELLLKSLGRNDSVAHSLIPFGLPGHDQGLGLSHDAAKGREFLHDPKLKTLTKQETLKLVTKQQHLPIAQKISEQLIKNLGLKITIQSLSAQDYSEVLKQSKNDFYIFTLTANESHSYADSLHSRANIFSRWQNKAYDGLVENAQDSMSTAEQSEYLKAAQKILLEDDIALIPLFYPRVPVIVSPKVKSFDLTPLSQVNLNKIQL